MSSNNDNTVSSEPMDVDLTNDPIDTDELDVSKNITKDCGVKKVIKKLGTGWEKPEAGDEVFVTYIGRLVPDGEVFDQNVDEGSPFSFTLGKGEWKVD